MCRESIFSQWNKNFQDAKKDGTEVPAEVKGARELANTLLAVPAESEFFGAYLSDTVYLYGIARAQGKEELLGAFLQLGFNLIVQDMMKGGSVRNVRVSAN